MTPKKLSSLFSSFLKFFLAFLERVRVVTKKEELYLSKQEVINLYKRFNELFSPYRANYDAAEYYIPELIEDQKLHCNIKFNPYIFSLRGGNIKSGGAIAHNCTSLIFDLLKAANKYYLPKRWWNAFVAHFISVFNPMLWGYSFGTIIDLANPKRGNPKRTLKPASTAFLFLMLTLTAIVPALVTCFLSYSSLCCKKIKNGCPFFFRNQFTIVALFSFLMTLIFTCVIAIGDVRSGDPFDWKYIGGVIAGSTLGFVSLVLNLIIFFRYDTKNFLIRPSALLYAIDLNANEKDLHANSQEFLQKQSMIDNKTPLLSPSINRGNDNLVKFNDRL